MRKHKILLTLISVIVLAGIIITASAVANSQKPHISAGKTENLIADRIAFSLENTEFTIKNPSDTDKTYTLTMFFEVKKTQGDFYGILESFTLTELPYSNMVFTALSAAASGKTTDSLVLTATDGEPDTFRWQIDVSLNIPEKGTYTGNVRLHYISGTSESDAMEKFADIPVTLTVE